MLIALNSKTTGSDKAHLMELIKLSPFFSQPAMSSHIEMNKSRLLHVRDLVLTTHSKVDELSTEEITAIAFASVLLGGSVWASLPRMFCRLDESKLTEVLFRLKPLLATKFTAPLAEWFCASWRYLEE